ncbi:MAG TPA: hypothetical protein VFG10_00810 [Saprospiraceae bacterium]|nr:hypothetical protein [Saprospiraceae bacterium]
MRHIHIIFLFLLTNSIFAQEDLPTGQIEVIKDFEVRLLETKKIRIIPQPIALDSAMRRYEYTLSAPSPAIEYVVAELKPLSINPEKKPPYYPLFVKAGYGNPNSLLGELSYDHLQNDMLQWGIDIRHLSANNKKIPLQKFSDSQGRINGSYKLKDNIQISGYVDGKFEKVYFYGADDIPSNPDALKRSFKRYDAQLTFANLGGENQPLRYSTFFQHHFDKDDLGSRESAVTLGGEVEYSLTANSFPIGLKAFIDYSTLKNTREQTINNVFLEPYFQFHLGGLKVNLGGIALLNKNKNIVSSKENEILPAIEVSYNLFKNSVTIEAGWQGEVYKNNFHNLSSYNPYINTRLDSIGNMISRRIYGGIKGATGKLQYAASGGYTTFEHMAFFLQDFDKREQFNPVFDNGSYFGYEGSVRFEVLKNVLLHAQAWQRFYSLDNEEKPWHRPTLGIDGMLTYSGGDDIYHASFILHSENGLPYRTVGGTEKRLDPLIDLNLHGDYYFSPSFGAFLQINNILGNNREPWYTYPSYGFNAKAGILFRM